MLSVAIDTRDLVRLSTLAVPAVGRQVPFATARALTDSSRDVKADFIQEMKQDFDRPTPWVTRHRSEPGDQAEP